MNPPSGAAGPPTFQGEASPVILPRTWHQDLLREETRLENNFRAQMGRKKGSPVGMTAGVVRRGCPHPVTADEDRGMPRMGESSPLQLPECTFPSRRRNGSLLSSAQLEERTSRHTGSAASNMAGWAHSLPFGWIIFFLMLRYAYVCFGSKFL